MLTRQALDSANNNLAMSGLQVSLCLNLLLLVTQISTNQLVSGSDCFGCRPEQDGVNDRHEGLNVNNQDRNSQNDNSELHTIHLLNDAITEQANNRSIYKSLMEIIHRLKSQAERKQMSNRLDSQVAETTSAQAEQIQVQAPDGKKVENDERRDWPPPETKSNQSSSVTVEIVNESSDEKRHQNFGGSVSQETKPPVQAAASTEIFEKRVPVYLITNQDSSTFPKQASEKNLSEWVPSAQSAIKSLVSLHSRATERWSRNNRKLDERHSNRDRATSLMDNLLSDVNTQQPNRQVNQANFQSAPWSKPVQSIQSAANLMYSGGGNTPKTSDPRERFASESSEFGDISGNVPANPNGPLIETAPSKTNDYYASGSEVQSQQPDGDEQVPTSTYGSHSNSASSGNSGARSPINPQAIRLQKVYPTTSNRQTISIDSQPSNQPYKSYDERNEPTFSRYGSGQTRAPVDANLINELIGNQNPDLGASNYNTQRQPMQIIPLRTDTSRVRLHRQPFSVPYRDLLDQPQTIQITAVPNNNQLITNGILGGNSLLRINGQLGNGWNTNGFLDPLSRPVVMVNAERRQLDWSFWIWPLVFVITLPIMLSALFVPIFLKTIITIIQILQSMGLLLPIANALSQQIVHATGASAGSGSMSALASTNHVTTEHHQKDELGVRNITATTIFSNSTI